MMRYTEFFRIEIDHQYFSSKGNADLVIVPDVLTSRRLKGLHCIVKATEKGMKVLIPTDELGNRKKTPETALGFNVFPGSRDFTSITDVSDLAEGEMFLFSNEGLTEPDSQLTSSGVTGPGIHNGFPQVAKIEIHPTEVLLTSTTSLSYQVRFKSKSEKWQYYFVADQETVDLQVVDVEERLAFTKMDWNGSPSEKVGKALEANFPDANLFLFESATAIAGSDQALRNLQLIRDGHVMIKHLPNPDIGDGAMKIIKIHKLISKQ